MQFSIEWRLTVFFRLVADIASLNQHPAKPTLNSSSSNAALLGGQLRDTAWHKLHLTCDETGKQAQRKRRRAIWQPAWYLEGTHLERLRARLGCSVRHTSFAKHLLHCAHSPQDGVGQTCIWPGFGVEMQRASAGINQQAVLAVMVGVRQESS